MSDEEDKIPSPAETPEPVENEPSPDAPETAPADEQKETFWNKLLGWDFFVTVFSVLGLALGVMIWYRPPLFRSDSLEVRCSYLDEPIEGVELYRPLSMPSRYYVRLPHELRKRYRWFSIDRRREICAIAEPPEDNIFGIPAIRRGDNLGMDLEFRHLDGSEWRIGFFKDSIVFSNALLSVRLEKKRD